MKILLKKLLEKLVLVVFFLLIIFGNVLVVYNVRNRFVNISEKYDITSIIDNAKYISVKDVSNNIVVIIDDENKKNKLKDIFNELKIRKSKLNLFDKEQKINYSIFIIDYNKKELFINFSNMEIMIYNDIYECDFDMSGKFEEILK